MSKITKAAEGRPCTIRLPGHCNGNPETSVWIHLPSIRWGSGRGHKVIDLIGAIGCSCCHDVVDGRVKTTLDRDFVKMCAYEGHLDRLMILWEEGII